ncbi:MAG TPA: tyrosine-type recombinase/integrase [Aliidongia sp.]|nr:tyrosine-type recombinase/integrase [Aliidongia sp.]
MDKPRYVETRKRADGTFAYVWNPSSKLKSAGFAFTVLGGDQKKAFKEADKLNAQVNDMRRTGKRDAAICEGTIGALARKFMASNDFGALAKNTQETYESSLTKLIEMQLRGRRLGDYKVDYLTPGKARALYEEIVETRGNGAGAYTVRVAQSMYGWGRLADLVRGENPFNKLRAKGTQPRAVTWTRDQREAFICKADELGYWSVGTVVLLCYEWALRPGDVLRFTWDQISDGHMTALTRKREVLVFQKLSERVQQRLGERPGTTGLIAPHPKDKPWDWFSWGELFREVREAAELPPSLQVRDLRRTAATEMIDAGLSDREVMAVGGWSSPASLKPYIAISKQRTTNALEKRWAYQTKLRDANS